MRTADGRVVEDYKKANGTHEKPDLSYVNVTNLQFIQDGDTCNFTILYMTQPGHIIMNGKLILRDLEVNLSNT